MSDSSTPQDDAAMSPASTGSVGLEDATMSENILATMAKEIALLRHAELRANDRAIRAEAKCSQLFAAGHLTEAERMALKMFSATAWTAVPWSVVERHAATLRGLLERLR